MTWTPSADYTGSFDNVKTDPDLSYQKIDKYKSGIHGRTPIHVRGRVYEHKVFIDGIHGKFVKKNIGFQCFSMWKVGDR